MTPWITFLRHLKWMVTILCVLSATLWISSLVGIGREVHLHGDFRLGNDFPEFQDILIYNTRFWLYHSADFYQLRNGFSSFAYPPADAPIYAALYRFSRPEVAYLVILAIWALFMGACIGRTLKPFVGQTTVSAFTACATLLFSFPLVFLAERANVELFVWMAIICGLLLFRKDKRIPAAVCFGLAASLKLYPLLLLGLFIDRRWHWRPIVCGITTFLVTTALALWYSGPTFVEAVHGYINGLSRFKTANGEAPRFVELRFDHSFFSPIKLAGLYGHLSARHWAPVYYTVASVLFIALFFFRVRYQPSLNRYMFLSICMVTLPPVSYEYTLVHLYAPTLLLMQNSLAQARDTTAPPSTAIILTLACALFVTLPFGLLGSEARQAGQIQVATLVSLLVLTAMYSWPKPGTALVQQA